MPRPPKYTDEELLDEIRRLARDVGRSPPLKRDMNDRGKHGAKTYQDRWGSWSEAVAAAGFEPREQGTDFDPRPDECPLCGNEASGMDFHHWRYGEIEVGCYLCRECHDAIHEGEASTQNPGWLVPCVKNLAQRHIEQHGDPDPDPDAILKRYNLTDVRDLVVRGIEEHEP